MARRKQGPRGHTGRTERGNTRDQKIERLGNVTIYKRGATYYLYYRENGRSERRRIEGNLAVARTTAAKVAAALGEERASPLGFQRTSPREVRDRFLDYIESVKKLAWRTQDRYRAALDRFVEFSEAVELKAVDAVNEETVDDFVRWLRGQTRTRNGAAKGKRDSYKLGGIKFILSTCRTAFNWARRRRMLPPYAENPFSESAIEELRDPTEEDQGHQIFTPDQERRFFKVSSKWQRGIFETLATYGLRVGELTHLLVEDVDFGAGVLHIRSKPELHWRIKTARRRDLPLTPEMALLLRGLIGKRKAGFVFLNEPFVAGNRRLPHRFASPADFRQHLEEIVRALAAEQPEATEKDKRRAVTAFCRSMGQIPAKRIRDEFCRLTREIGCPEFTRAHNLRHLFSSRAQERGINPLLVQEILGHASLDMTRRYTHLGLDVKREAIEKLNDLRTPNSEE